jgi:hypothetical protein
MQFTIGMTVLERSFVKYSRSPLGVNNQISPGPYTDCNILHSYEFEYCHL